MMSKCFLKASIKNEVMKKSASNTEKQTNRKAQSALPPTKSSKNALGDNQIITDSFLEKKKRPEKSFSASNINKKKRFVIYLLFFIFDVGSHLIDFAKRRIHINRQFHPISCFSQIIFKKS